MTSELGKIMPHDTELEEVVLGSILLEQRAFDKVSDILHKDLFYSSVNQWIYIAISNLNKVNLPIDIITATQALKKANRLEDCGGAYHITKLTNRISSAAHILTHARLLQQMYFKRSAIKVGYEMVEKGYDGSEDALDLIAHSINAIKKIEDDINIEKSETSDMVIDKILDNIKEASENGGVIGYSTGMKNVDHAIMGLRPGLKYVIAASPGEGKTSLGKSICLNLSKQGVPGVFFSLEMTSNQLMMSCISELLDIDNEQLQKGQLRPEQLKAIASIKDTVFSKNFIIDPTPGLDPTTLRRKVAKYVLNYNIKWIAIDYIGLMKLKAYEAKGKNKEQIVSDITADIKNIAKEFNLITFELSQVSRDSRKSGRRYQLHDLKDSGAIEANADVVMFPYRPFYHGDGANGEDFAELLIRKNRFGRLQTIGLIFNGSTTSFRDNPSGIELEELTDEDAEAF